MADSAYRVRIGSDIKFYNDNADKQPVAYCSLAEDQYGKNTHTGTYEVVNTRWYKGTFSGRDAEQLAEHFQKGDPLVVIGNDRLEKTYDGSNEYVNARLFVKSFGPDATLTHARIDREQVAQDKAQRQAQQQTRGFAQDAPAQPGQGQSRAQAAQAAYQAEQQASQQARQYLQQSQPQAGYGQQPF